MLPEIDTTSLKLSSTVPTRPTARAQEKLVNSPFRFEAIRLMLDGLTDERVAEQLDIVFNYRCSTATIAAFRDNYLSMYGYLVEKWDKSRSQTLIARSTSEMKAVSSKVAKEVFELQKLVEIADERIDLIRTNPERQSAAYEGVLKDLIKTKALLLERMSKITGTTGMEERLKEVIKKTAQAIQRTLIPHLKEEEKESAFEAFEKEITAILVAVEADTVINL